MQYFSYVTVVLWSYVFQEHITINFSHEFNTPLAFQVQEVCPHGRAGHRPSPRARRPRPAPGLRPGPHAAHVQGRTGQGLPVQEGLRVQAEEGPQVFKVKEKMGCSGQPNFLSTCIFAYCTSPLYEARVKRI